MPIMPMGERLLCRTRAWQRVAAALVPWSISGERLAGDVLEIGGGSGATAAAVHRRFPDIRLTFADLDPLMVATAERRLRPDVATVEADATALPFPDESFDVVLSFLMLHHVGDWERAVAEAVRVLRPGGRFIGYDLVDGLRTRGIHHLDAIHDLRAVTPDSLRTALAAAGIGRVQLRSGRTRLTVRWVARKVARAG